MPHVLLQDVPDLLIPEEDHPVQAFTLGCPAPRLGGRNSGLLREMADHFLLLPVHPAGNGRHEELP
jgi:hypothetical protein